MPEACSRRAALAAMLVAAAGCSRRPAASTVVLYSSVDDYLLREVVPILQASTGLTIATVGDTEATKTFGLVQRLLAERNRPRADVWWSSEPFGTIQLARQGVLSPAPDDLAAAWPAHLRGTDNLWLGFGSRYRVIAFAPSRVADPPRTLRDLPSGYRVGMARPQFGTTRGHMAAVLSVWGESEYRSWLTDLRAASVRLYDGNASVVRAIAQGEIDVGLTDSDDVFASERNGWEVSLLTEAIEPRGQVRRSFGAMLLPNTVALVRNGPSSGMGARLVGGILSDEVALALARSDSRNIPVSQELAAQSGVAVPAQTAALDLEHVADFLEPAVSMCLEVFGS